MNITPKTFDRIAGRCFAVAFSLLVLSSFGSPVINPSRIGLTDTVRNNGKVREVLLSQQLFLVKATPLKGPKAKKGDVNFKGELRDAFMVILYAKDTAITELDWAMCPNGKCPIGKTYSEGTAEYTQLDTWIANARKNNAEVQKRLNKLRSGKKGVRFKQ